MQQFLGGVLDLDGVVVDTEALHLEATLIVFARHDLRLPEGGAAAYVGRTDLDIFTDALGRSAIKDMDVLELLAAKNEVYGTITDRMQAIPGAVQFIRRVAESEMALALATSSVRTNQMRAFLRFGLDAYFDAIVTADDVINTKPDPEPYALAVSRLGLQPDRCFVVEDSFNGVRSAKSAGCRVIGLTTSFPADKLEDAGADLTADSFDEIYEYVGLEGA